MKCGALILPLVGIFWVFLKASEYVYPIGTFSDFEGQKSVLTFYQKSPEHTELWQGNLETTDSNRAVLSTFTPVGVALLPNNAGFSFFDNGRLRVKQFLKRSPKAIDIYEPIYDIGPLQWLTSDTCIFHAKEREIFSLYQLTFDGSVSCLVKKGTCDCFYPSVIGSFLYYIERRVGGEYAIMRREYSEKHLEVKESIFKPSMIEKCTFECTEPIKEPVVNDQCLISQSRPLAFLTMTGECEGFVIEHPIDVDLHKDLSLTCTLYRLICDTTNNVQNVLQSLCTIALPLSLLNSRSRDHLSESLYPLLPKVIEGTLYFVTTIDNDCMQICSYTEGKVKILKKGLPGQILFTPVVYTDDLLVYGSSLPLTWSKEDHDPTSGLGLLSK